MKPRRPSQPDNKYILLDLIGAGGMAEVYRCKLSGQQGFEKIMVLKKLLPQVAHDPEIVSNFIEEAKLAALLQHENIAHIFDFGEIANNYFIAMEYLFGKDLYTIMQRVKKRGGPMDAEIALLIASKVCAGMEYAHTLKDLQQRPLNIIHRDLTPHNVFITYDGKVKIIDFGIAKAELFDNKTKAGVIKGKISYMSPEQFTDKKIDLRSDIFAIGILLYEMLSGKRMYSGDTATLIRKCMQMEYEKLDKILPGLNPQIYDIVNKALQKDVGLRYQSCAQMHTDIDDCLYGTQQRPNSQTLKHYILQLFEKDYEEEKSNLLTTIEKFDEIYGTGKSSTKQLEEIPARITNQEKSRLFNATDEKTLIIESADTNRFSSFFLPQLYHSFLQISPLRKSIIVVISFILVIVLFNAIGQKANDWWSEPEIGNKANLVIEETETEVSITPQPPPLSINTESNENPTQINTSKQIEDLLGKAKKAFDNQRFTDPKHDSAYSYYIQILEISPDNNVARDGLRLVGEKYAELAERELYKNNVSGAKIYAQKGLHVFPESGRLLTLQSLIEKEKKRLIEEFEWRAQRSLEKNDLTLPVENCAYKYYLDIQKLDKNNQQALKGMQLIGDKYAEFAENAYRNLDLVKARDFVNKGLMVKPDHDHLLDLKRDLSRSKAGIFFKMLEKNIETYTQ